jgi:hypothetical protein
MQAQTISTVKSANPPVQTVSTPPDVFPVLIRFTSLTTPVPPHVLTGTLKILLIILVITVSVPVALVPAGQLVSVVVKDSGTQLPVPLYVTPEILATI